MKNIIGLVIFLISSFLSGAEVLKLSKNRSSLAISNDLDNIWFIGQKICIDARNGERFCGIVVKVKTEGAICKMEAPALAVEIGDTVTMVEPLDKVNSDNKRNKSATEKAAKRGLVLGLGGGLVLGDLSIDPNVTESDWKKGMSLGLFLEIPIGYGTFSLQPGLGFSQKGYEESSTSLGLNYLDLPLLIKVGFLQGDVVPYLTAGPYVAFLMTAKNKTLFGESDVKELFNKIDCGLIGGVGLDIGISREIKIGLGANYGMGLLNILDSSIQTQKNRIIKISLELAFKV